jgi:succinate dehydrogenase / fumarate reductase flavoprotein subunit
MSMRILDTGVLVIGAGAAGMSAAIAAADAGAAVMLLDRSLIGRGGATVMAQMTVAVALGEQTEDDWRFHLADTLAAGRGLCDAAMARTVCEQGIEAIRQLESWKVGWAREDDHLKQAHAPGHDRPRCVYVDFLNTGPAVAQTLRTQVNRRPGIHRVGDLCVTEIITDASGAAVGATALHLPTGEMLAIRAPAVIVATGGLTRLYRRNSASVNMGGDGYAIALRAGAELIDMEFVQFFPIGHLAPRMIGMDPIMWDPFRYKLGGRLLNGEGEEFTSRYGVTETGRYAITRDLATYAITKEVEAGRGSPAGGAYLSFEHVPEAQLRAAFGPIIERLAANGIDLTKTAVEVAPIAHYHMGGIRVDAQLQTRVAGLYAAGEAVGGANGANRLSGNAITEAMVFGKIAGLNGAKRAADKNSGADDATMQAGLEALAGRLAHETVLAAANRRTNSSADPSGDSAADSVADSAAEPIERNVAVSAAQRIVELQALMQDDVGPFRSETGLTRALETIVAWRAESIVNSTGAALGYDTDHLDRLDLRNMLCAAEAVTRSALARTESRGAHQREDYPAQQDQWTLNQTLQWADGRLQLGQQAVLTDAGPDAVPAAGQNGTLTRLPVVSKPAAKVASTEAE